MAADALQFFELSLDLLCTVTADYRFDCLSPSWENTLGWTLEELRTMKTLDLCHPDDIPATVAKAEEMLTSQTHAVLFENRFRHKAGHYVWLSWVGRVKQQKFYSIARDISAYKLQEEHLRAANAELREFAYAASHDLQEPLRLIAGYIQLLDAQGLVPGELSPTFDQIKGAAERMQAMLDGLLEYSRFDKCARSQEPVVLGSVVQEVIRAYPDMEFAIGPLPVLLGEQSQLERLVQNILQNASRYRHPDRAPRVEITGEKAGSQLVLRFRDNGIGIRSGQERRALEIFARCHARSRYPQGQGLGLALCRRIAARHGGCIRLENNADGIGLTVIVELEAQP